tara:strand:- start:148 stop:252 length:105 start_codon:yes stop_codon:yes gene_type:complete
MKLDFVVINTPAMLILTLGAASILSYIINRINNG